MQITLCKINNFKYLDLAATVPGVPLNRLFAPKCPPPKKCPAYIYEKWAEKYTFSDLKNSKTLTPLAPPGGLELWTHCKTPSGPQEASTISRNYHAEKCLFLNPFLIKNIYFSKIDKKMRRANAQGCLNHRSGWNATCIWQLLGEAIEYWSLV